MPSLRDIIAAEQAVKAQEEAQEQAARNGTQPGDDDLAAAIAASLAEYEASQGSATPDEAAQLVAQMDEDAALAAALQAEEDAESRRAVDMRRDPSGKVTLVPGWAPFQRAQEHMYTGDAEKDEVEAAEEEEYAALAGARLRVDGSGKLVSKHDASISGRRNARILEATHPGAAGDMSGLRVPNAALGSLKRHFAKSTRKGQAAHGRIAAEEQKVVQGVLDSRTRLMLFKLAAGGWVDGIGGVLKEGKESAVHFATGWNPSPDVGTHGHLPSVAHARINATLPSSMQLSERELEHATPHGGAGSDEEDAASTVGSGSVSMLSVPEPAARHHHRACAWPVLCTPEPGMDVAVKIFKTTAREFSNRLDYVDGDWRFKRAMSGNDLSWQNPRTMIKLWAGKEWSNLHRMWRAGLPCAAPLMLRQHVLLMAFIGEDGWPAPQLREARLRGRELRTAYLHTLRIVAALWHRCHLVHADLSAYNLLWHGGRVWVIDVAQAVECGHPKALDFLQRDLESVTRFFGAKGVATLSPDDAMCVVTSAATLDPASTAHSAFQSSQGRQAHAEVDEVEVPVLCSKADPVMAVIKGMVVGDIAIPELEVSRRPPEDPFVGSVLPTCAATAGPAEPATEARVGSAHVAAT